MAAKVSDRVQRLVSEASELPATDLIALAEAIDSLLCRDETAADRHAVIAERIARVDGSEVTCSGSFGHPARAGARDHAARRR